MPQRAPEMAGLPENTAGLCGARDQFPERRNREFQGDEQGTSAANHGKRKDAGAWRREIDDCPRLAIEHSKGSRSAAV